MLFFLPLDVVRFKTEVLYNPTSEVEQDLF